MFVTMVSDHLDPGKASIFNSIAGAFYLATSGMFKKHLNIYGYISVLSQDLSFVNSSEQILP